MSDPFTAWQCIGCGKLEAPQRCIGVCRDRKVELVDARELADARAQVDALRTLVRRLALVTPRDGAWEKGYRAMQRDARALLLAASGAPTDPDQ